MAFQIVIQASAAESRGREFDKRAANYLLSSALSAFHRAFEGDANHHPDYN